MADYCNNVVMFSGENTQLLNLKNWIRTHLTSDLNHQNITSLPLNIQTDKDPLEIIGTTTIDINELYINDEKALILNAETKYTPFNPLLVLLSNKFNVDFENVYLEPNNEVCGVYNTVNGEIIDKQYNDVREYYFNHFSDEDLEEYIKENVAYWELDELEFFEDRLTDEFYKKCLILLASEI